MLSSHFSLLISIGIVALCSGFSPLFHQRTSLSSATKTSPSSLSSFNHKFSTTCLQMAGFGGGGKSSKAGSKKGKKNGSNKQAPLTLKPKQQWDRYANLKAATAVRVGVRVVNDGEETNEWFETGKVKSENDESIEVAVFMQRGIIAEHSKRLYPLKILPKDRVEWGFSRSTTPEQSDWVLINKDEVGEAPAGFEKVIGFEGKPDPASGFYCHYENGRLVDRYSGDVVAKE